MCEGVGFVFFFSKDKLLQSMENQPPWKCVWNIIKSLDLEYFSFLNDASHSKLALMFSDLTVLLLPDFKHLMQVYFHFI